MLIFHHGPAFTLIALAGYGLIGTIFASLLTAVLKGNVLARKQARLLWALYGLRFMDVVPIARTTLIERMVDAVLVLDTRGNLVDFNPAAQSILSLHLTDLWTPWAQALARWPEIIAALNHPIEPRALEITLSASGAIFELSLSSLRTLATRPMVC